MDREGVRRREGVLTADPHGVEDEAIGLARGRAESSANHLAPKGAGLGRTQQDDAVGLRGVEAFGEQVDVAEDSQLALLERLDRAGTELARAAVGVTGLDAALAEQGDQFDGGLDLGQEGDGLLAVPAVQLGDDAVGHGLKGVVVTAHTDQTHLDGHLLGHRADEVTLLDEGADGDLVGGDEADGLQFLAVEAIRGGGHGNLGASEHGVELSPRRGDSMVGFVEDDQCGRLILGGDMVEVSREDREGFADDAGTNHRGSGLVNQFLAVGDEETLAVRTDLPAEHDRRSNHRLASTRGGDDERVNALGQVRQRGGHGGFLIVSELQFHVTWRRRGCGTSWRRGLCTADACCHGGE